MTNGTPVLHASNKQGTTETFHQNYGHIPKCQFFANPGRPENNLTRTLRKFLSIARHIGQIDLEKEPRGQTENDLCGRNPVIFARLIEVK